MAEFGENNKSAVGPPVAGWKAASGAGGISPETPVSNGNCSVPNTVKRLQNQSSCESPTWESPGSDSASKAIPRRSSLIKDGTRAGRDRKKTVSFSSSLSEKKISSAADCIHSMVEGIELKKIRTNSRVYQRYYLLDAGLQALCWEPSKKESDKARISLASIREVRTGRNTETFRTSGVYEQISEDSAFSIIYGEMYESLDLVANSAEVANIWVTGLRYLMQYGKHALDMLSSSQDSLRLDWLEQLFCTAADSDDLEEDEEGIRLQLAIKLIRNVNPGVGSSKVEHSNKEYLDTKDLMRFLEAEQGMAQVSEETSLKLIHSHEPSEEGRQQGYLSLDGFTSYLTSAECHLFDREHDGVCQDMTQPLSHYYISSSHNTYLIEDQFRGPSDISGYIRALKMGCRCVEVDVWDGPDGDPVTAGLMMDLNTAWFRQNGNCGFVLRPAIMRQEVSYFSADTRDTVPGVSPQLLHVKVISGQNLPKPRGSGAKGDVVDPYVYVEIHGIPADCTERRTRTVTQNGDNPVFDESFEFQINLPELAMVRFVVLDDDFIGDEFIGQYTIPLECLQPGYRHVPLQSLTGEELPHAKLFVHVALTNRRGGGKPHKRGLSVRKARKRRNYAALRDLGVRAVDEVFKMAAPPLKDATDLRENMQNSVAVFRDLCGVSVAANLMQCVLALGSRVSGPDGAPLLLFDLRDHYPALEPQGPLPDVLRRVVSTYEMMVQASRAVIELSDGIYDRILHIQTMAMEFHEKLQSLAEKEGLRGRKVSRALESFSWNITILKGQADLLKHAQAEVQENMKQVHDAALTGNLTKERIGVKRVRSQTRRGQDD
ncbi:hypothetical protein PBY51_005373 [Eleginops maclovinus]|uniref:Phosphoinositide phospholipase C n=1 Tax=Eleginops maclovinus TaxID=56733 RepID=A0AAN8ACX5_ELEMC|nr:hypothetical protein PBY51_005373 [Eleginops maclovinus]